MLPVMSEPCPCQSGTPLERCCGPLLAGAPAPTAEALMRSRYTAYARGAIDHVVATHDPATAGDIDREATLRWSKEAEWTGLAIAAKENGGEGDDDGMVEFIARYRAGGHDLTHHERSRFRRIDGRWFYVDGDIVKPPPARRTETAGRNDPCPCGSGKKYKRCHGAG